MDLLSILNTMWFSIVVGSFLVIVGAVQGWPRKQRNLTWRAGAAALVICGVVLILHGLHVL